MKDVKLKLIAELTKNSLRSDRELAKHLRISQPTVSRIRTRLEKEGVPYAGYISVQLVNKAPTRVDSAYVKVDYLSRAR